MHARRARLAPLALAPLVALGQCRPGTGGSPSASPAGAEPAPSTGGATDGATRTNAEPVANGPAPRVAPAALERITLRTADGWTLAGELIPEPSPGVVILVHQLSSNRSEWGPLVARLHEGRSPLATLAIDLRGHGESTRGPDGPTVWQSFGSERAKWAGLVADVDAAVNYVHARVTPNAPIVLVGSSIGSTAVLRHAADDASVAGVVLLSPGAAYRGLDTLEPMSRYASSGRPALLVAAAGDHNAADSVRQLVARAAGHDGIESEIFPELAAHGVSMAAEGAHPELWARIDTWIRGAIAPQPAPASARDH